MNSNEINPLETSINADELEHVNIATLRIWKNKLLDEIGHYATNKDYDHPLVDEYIHNLHEINIALGRGIYTRNTN